MFIENGDEAIIANLHVRYPNALLVGNGVEFVANGGMVAFIKVRNRIRPLISRQNVEKSRVQIRSQLLEVSEIYEEAT
ncbi:valyl-tRNA synthetase [Vibrio sp. 16]|nr:valyl-tRNA synthetase [Vibrio sp. 16]